MSPRSSLAAPAELRLLGGAVAGATQAQLERVVALIDELADRAEADRILERVRPRLRELRLPRRMGFSRVLFLPLDGVIVSPAKWQPGLPLLPRTALSPLAAAVRTALGPSAEAITARCAGRRGEGKAGLGAIGADLWSAAARLLPEAVPAGWRNTGLADRDYPSLRALCIAAWRHAGTSWPALEAAAEGPPEELIREALEPAAAEGGLAFEVVLRTLMAAAARPASVAAIAARLAPPGSAAALGVAQRAVDDLLQAKDTAALFSEEAGDAASVAAAALAVCTLVEDFETSSFLNLPARRERVRAIRKAADEACRSSFKRLLNTNLLEAPQGLAAAAPGEADAIVAGMEGAARALRRIEASGRRLGGAERYDAALRAAATAIVKGGAEGNGLTRPDMLRLVEILLGPQAALEMVNQPRRPGSTPAPARGTPALQRA